MKNAMKTFCFVDRYAMKKILTFLLFGIVFFAPISHDARGTIKCAHADLIGELPGPENTDLMSLADDGDVEGVKKLLAGKFIKVNVNAQNNYGYTALMLAAKNGHTEIVKMLIGAKANINVRREDRYPGSLSTLLLSREEAYVAHEVRGEGGTALTIATEHGHAEIVKLLLEAKADVNKKSNDDYTAITLASLLGHAEIVKLLLEAGADVNAMARVYANVSAEGNNGKTALMIASEEGYVETVRLLLAAGADVNMKGYEGTSALGLASKNGHVAIVKLLLDVGADVNMKGD